ncbi:MAG: hypothetical protein APF76_07355 [Desulfitibacter sp. BRH_c19]|nr:MAG: hypothetical protein APF76_07355 [Desulfitibacter sp. BRH_c19]
MSLKKKVQKENKPSKRPSTTDTYKTMGTPRTGFYALEYVIRKNNQLDIGETPKMKTTFLMPKYLPIPREIKPTILPTIIILIALLLITFNQYATALLAFTAFIFISLKRWKSTNQKAFKKFMRGKDLFERRKYDQALNFFNEAAEIFPSSSDLQLLLGKLTAFLIDFTKSVEHFSNYFESNHDDQETRVEYAASLLADRKPEKALSILQSLPAYAKNSLPVVTLIASCLLELNKHEEALEVMKNISLDNEDEVINTGKMFFRYILATVYQKLGKNNESLEQYRLIHAEDKDFIDVAKKLHPVTE